MAITLANLYTTGWSAANATSVTSGSLSMTNNNTVAFPVRWGQGSGGTTRTLSTVTASSSETCTIVTGTDRESTTGVWEQWVVCSHLSGTSSRTFTANLSGQAAAVEIPFFIELGSTTSGTAYGVVAIDGNAFGDPEEVTLSSVTANSALLLVNSANDASGSVEAGLTSITMPATPFSANGDVPKAAYKLDSGASGSKTVGWSGTTGVWSISAIEIKGASASSVALSGSAGTGGHGTQLPSISVAL